MPAPAPDRLHAVPLPITWDLLGGLRRRLPPPLADTLSSIFDETVSRTILHARRTDGPDEGPPLGRLIRNFAPLRREWLDVAREAVGDAGITPLRVEALALARGVVARIRPDAPARDDLEWALGDMGPILSQFGVAVRHGRRLDLSALRGLATRFDWCVTAALLAETDGSFAGLSRLAPLLGAEARSAASSMRQLIDPEHAARCGDAAVGARG